MIAGAIVVHYESAGQTITRAYYDRVGQAWTICDGHTRGVKAGDTATPAQCEAYRRADLDVAAADVARCIHVPLKVNERAAFQSAAFNLGAQVVCGSTLQRLANAGDITGACLQLTDALDKRGNAVGWTSPGTPVAQGLRNRRTDERNLCLGYAP